MALIPHLRWWIAGLIFLNTVKNYADRQALSIVAPILTKDLGIDNVAYGYITQAFLIAYTGMYLGSGILIDRYGVKLVYAVATAWWSVASVLHAFAYSAPVLGFLRFLLGLGESANFIAAERVAADWYPPKDRGTLNGLVQAGAVTGAILTPPMVVFVSQVAGWRWAFALLGVTGLPWIAAWWWLYHLPENHPRITRQERELILGSSGRRAGQHEEPRLPRTSLLRVPQTWGLLVSRIISDPVWWFYLFWLPKYLTEARGMTMNEMALVAWIPYLFSDAGSLLGGWASGWLTTRGRDVLRARLTVMLFSVLLMPAGLIIAFTASRTVAIAVICLVLFAHMSWKTNLATLTVDLYPRSAVGSAAGLVAMGSGIGGAIFTVVAGSLIQSQSYVPIFVIMAFLHPIAYLVVHSLVRGPVRLQAQNA